MVVVGPSGTDRVAAVYGQPVEWWCRYDVAEGGIAYWEQVASSRSAEVVLVLQREGGRVLLHTKSYYPEGAYRLLTGGVHPGEDLQAAVEREGAEETGLHLAVQRYLGLIRNAFVADGRRAALDSHVLLVTAEDGTPAAADASEGITAFREVPVEELLHVADALERLQPPWADWGRFRATAHRLAYEALTGRSSYHG